MIPDDPLGRDGPHLDTFLCKDNRYSFFFVVCLFYLSFFSEDSCDAFNG